MTLYAASCELSSISHSGTATEDTTAGRFDGSYGIRASAQPGTASTAYITTGAGLGSFTDFWHGFHVWGTTAWVSGRVLARYFNSSGTAVFQLYFSSAGVLQAQYWNGSAWTNIGATYSPSLGTVLRFDVHIVCGGSGSFEVLVDGISQLSGSASMTSVTNIDEIRGYSTHNSSVNWTAHFSEFIWGDESTLGTRYALAPPTGNGTDTAGSGSYTDVDEAVTNDADISTLSNNGDAETYTHGSMTLPSGTVKAVQVEGRVRNVAGGAQNVKARLRIGGTAYDQGSNFAGIGAAFTPYRAHWATNPAGGSWTPTTAGQTSNEFGLVAQT